MRYRTRTYCTDAQKALMWERWKQGWTLHQIAHLFNRGHGSVHGILSRTGGIRPPTRTRCATALTLAEREEISRAMAKGQSIRSIAARRCRAPSTVSREISRNGGQAIRALGLEVRAGLHTGECETVGAKVSDVAVHIAAGVAAAALPGQVLVSSTVKD